MLLLPQLVQIWLPDDSEAHQEPNRSPLSEQTPTSQIPPLISFLEALPDAVTPDDFKGKTLPCGHVVSVPSLLACCNIFGDAVWTPGPHLFGCAEPDESCDELMEFPKLPDPRVLDGLAARLDLIQWSWSEDTPTDHDVHTVSLLRDILSNIGHVDPNSNPETDADSPHTDQDSEAQTNAESPHIDPKSNPETDTDSPHIDQDSDSQDAESPRSAPSEFSLAQTLVL